MVKVRSAYNYDRDSFSRATAFHPVGEDRTIQSAKDECDINVIVRRFGVTGQLPSNIRAPLTGDFTGVVDFQSAMNAINASQEAFLAMPSELRAELNHDVGEFIKWCEDPANKDRMKKYGLLRPGEDPVVPPVVPPPAA